MINQSIHLLSGEREAADKRAAASFSLAWRRKFGITGSQKREAAGNDVN
jgi:hypothetical protein